ncbi:MAG: universal stress protein [Nitrospirae bacterium]|nr:universal stress protein [Nitrospirota bacterium]
MIKTILVATDGSKTAWKAVTYAAELARQTRAALTAISVIDKTWFLTQSVSAPATPTHLIEPVDDYLRQAAEGYLERAEDLCRKKGVQFTRVITAGHPVEEIVKEAERAKADLIVLGSRGKGIVRAAVLGSITFGVMNRETKIPVLVVRK